MEGEGLRMNKTRLGYKENQGQRRWLYRVSLKCPIFCRGPYNRLTSESHFHRLIKSLELEQTSRIYWPISHSTLALVGLRNLDYPGEEGERGRESIMFKMTALNLKRQNKLKAQNQNNISFGKIKKYKLLCISVSVCHI